MNDSLEMIKAGAAFYEYDKKSKGPTGNEERDLIHAQSLTILDLQKRVTAMENYIMKIVFEKSLQTCKTVLN